MFKLKMLGYLNAPLIVALSVLSSACAGGVGVGPVTGNENGSEPINNNEAVEYKKAVVRCYKTGGSRIVKIMGELRCY